MFTDHMRKIFKDVEDYQIRNGLVQLNIRSHEFFTIVCLDKIKYIGEVEMNVSDEEEEVEKAVLDE